MESDITDPSRQHESSPDHGIAYCGLHCDTLKSQERAHKDAHIKNLEKMCRVGIEEFVARPKLR